MKDGFIKVAAATPEIKVADCEYNAMQIVNMMTEAQKEMANLFVFPELCITGSTCGDLFFQTTLIDGAKSALKTIIGKSIYFETVFVVGCPLLVKNKLFNCGIVIYKGSVLGVVPKTAIGENANSDVRYFSNDASDISEILLFDKKVPFGCNLIFECNTLSQFSFSLEIGEDIFLAKPLCEKYAASGASIIVNPSSIPETVGNIQYIKNIISSQSGRLNCGYVYCNSGYGESTTDYVFASNQIIAENGKILNCSDNFIKNITISEIDVEMLCSQRAKNTYFKVQNSDCETILFDMEIRETSLTREITPMPFTPKDDLSRCDRILKIQSYGLKKRIEHTNCKKLVIGISGGLDSCLALIVAVNTLKLCKRSNEDILAITMPCFGTTLRTKSNAEKLCEYLGVELECIDIKNAVNSHFEDIKHNTDSLDVVYENSQARERTQILMDIANKYNGMVIGTGDLSELALGWATYNGDHMSMYGVNANIPKTLVRHIVKYYADISDKNIRDVLYDILDTPVSPELLPTDDNDISQKTEELVGPYELHDFFLYYIIRYGFSPQKIYRLAKIAMMEKYSDETILKWLKNFYRRFFAQQFKRSCLPDGPKVGTVGLSPRGDFKMPSDAIGKLWLNQAEKIL